ncbi:DUF1565 domain-containing protein [Paenibacillus rhizoplanae]
MEYHVALQGSDQAPGTAEQPFRSISRAAALAEPGDTVTVHAGTYREWVSPANGGTEEQRIVYQAAGDGEVVITGAEPVADWQDEGDGVWSAEVPNSLFAVRNPFKEKLYGDWLFEGAFEPHLGGRSTWTVNRCMNVIALPSCAILRYGRRPSTQRTLCCSGMQK